jgi:phosphoglycerate dehydrogenase-like enzyme
MSDQRLKVYIDNASGIPPVFLITQDILDAQLRSRPALRARADIRIGHGAEAFKTAMRDTDVLAGWIFPTIGLRQSAPRLRWIQLIGAGLDHLLPLDWLPDDIVLTRASGAHRPKVDEFMMLSLLMLNNRVPELASNQRKGKFEYVYSTAITGKTALVIGLGATGSAAANSCKKLGLTVLGVRNSGVPHPEVDELHGPDALPDLLPRADFIIVTVPKTSRTMGLLDRAALRRAKRGAGLINLGRLGVVNEMALMDLLEEGHLSGAVYDLEDPHDVPSPDRLWSTDKILLIPHSLNNDPDRFIANALSIFLDNLERYVAGEALMNRVDPKKEY